MSKPNFLGIIASGSSLREAAVAYRDAAIGKKAYVAADEGNNFLFMSNVDPAEIVVSNPVTGELDLRSVPKALKSVSFSSESSAVEAKAYYTICNGESGCGSHIVYDDRDALNFCPVCNESISSDLSAEEISKELSADDLASMINIKDAVSDDSDDEDLSASLSSDSEDDDEDIVMNSVDDEDDDDDDEEDEYESESASMEEGDDNSEFTLQEMSDDEIMELHEKEGQKIEASSEGENEADENDDSISLTNKELESIRDELLRDAKRDIMSSNSSGSEDKYVANCDNMVAISRTQTKALNKYRSMLLSSVPMKVVASSKSNNGYLTIAKDVNVFKHDVVSGEEIDGVVDVDNEEVVDENGNMVSQSSSKKFISAFTSSSHDHSIADMFQCSSSNCGVYIVTSATESKNCPLCASKLQEPETVEDDVIPVMEDAKSKVETTALASALGELDSLDSEDVDLTDFDLTEMDDSDPTHASLSSDDIDEDLEEEVSNNGNVASFQKAAEKKAAQAQTDEEDNEDYPTLAASSISVNKNNVKMSLLAANVDEINNSKHEFLNVVFCGSLSCTNQDDHPVREDTWTAFYKNTPVAYATLSSSITHKDIFHQPVFAEAVLASAKVNGISKALKDMGFKPFMANLSVRDNVNKLVASEIEKTKEELSKENAEKQADYDNRLLAALSTAAIGINRGFFRNLSNPIKASLWNSLSAVGVRNPEALIDSVFMSQSDSYHKTLFEKAKEIVSKPLEIQNELAKAVVDSNYTAQASSSNNAPNQQGSFEDRLSSMGNISSHNNSSATAQAKNTQGSFSSESSDNMDSRILKVVSGLGRR